MKYVILLALFALAAAQHHGDPLHHLIQTEVNQIVSNNAGISVDDCTSKCDALFDLAAGHDEEMTDRLCHEECMRALNHHHTHPTHQAHTHPMHPTRA